MDTAAMRTRGPISTRVYINLLLALIGVGVALLVLELGLRITRDSSEEKVPLHVTCGDCPYLYELNPDHPDVRDRNMRPEPFGGALAVDVQRHRAGRFGGIRGRPLV